MQDFFKILLVVAIVSFLRYFFGLHDSLIGIDDANIYFVYAKNLQMGYGFVYNPGGEHVEGFTSIGWTLLLALFYAIKFIPFEISILVLSFLITTATVYLYFRFVKEHFNSEIIGWIFVFSMVFIPGFIEWNVFSLMDLCLWILVVSWITLIFLKDKTDTKMFLVLLVALPLVRPEGMAVAFIFVFFKIVKDYLKFNAVLVALRRNVISTSLVIMSISALVIFRLWYFGFPLPNTFYAKVSMSMTDNIIGGVRYVYLSLRQTSMLPFILFLIIAVTLVRPTYIKKFREEAKSYLLFALVLFFLIYPFMSGGDHFRYSRFYQAVFPIITILFLLLYARHFKKPNSVVAILAVIVVIIGNLNTLESPSLKNDWQNALSSYFKSIRLDFVNPSQLQTEFDIALYGRNLAEHINDVFDGHTALPSFGVVAAGGIAYSYKGPVVDLMGLNNLKMAHADKVKNSVLKNHGSFNKTVLLEQQPDIFLSWPDYSGCALQQDDSSAIQFAKQLRQPEFFWNSIFKNVFNDQGFVGHYSFCKISNGSKHLYSFVNADDFRQKYPRLIITNMDSLESVGMASVH